MGNARFAGGEGVARRLGRRGAMRGASRRREEECVRGMTRGSAYLGKRVDVYITYLSGRGARRTAPERGKYQFRTGARHYGRAWMGG